MRNATLAFNLVLLVLSWVALNLLWYPEFGYATMPTQALLSVAACSPGWGFVYLCTREYDE